MIKITTYFIKKTENSFALSINRHYLLSPTRENISQKQGHLAHPQQPSVIFDSNWG